MLADVAKIQIVDGPPMLKSENARLSGWVYVDVRGRDLQSAVREMQQAVTEQVDVPPGYSLSWSGQFEYLERATERLSAATGEATLCGLYLETDEKTGLARRIEPVRVGGRLAPTLPG